MDEGGAQGVQPRAVTRTIALLNPMMNALKKVLKVALGLLGAWVLLLIVYMAYGMYQEPRAEAKARSFCASVKVGDSAEDLVPRALAEGSLATFTKWTPLAVRSPDERQLLVIFVGLPPFSRHVCEIRATSHVLDAHYTHLD